MTKPRSTNPRRLSAWTLSTFLVLANSATSLRAELHFTQPTVAAGEIRAGTPLVHKFAFVNKGPEAVEITDVHASCGCMTPRLEKSTCQPGEEGFLVLEINTLNQATGPRSWRVQVTYRAGAASQEIPLLMTGTIVTEITVQPAAMTIFADSRVGHDIVLTDLRTKPLAVREVQTSSPLLKAQIAGKAVDAQGHTVQKVNLVVAAEFSEGRHEEAVVLFTDDPTYPELKVPVTVIKRSRQSLTALPDKIDLKSEPGQPVPSRIVLVRDKDQKEVMLTGVDADNPAVSCRWAKGPGAMATVKISVDRKRLSGDKLETAVHVHVSQPVAQDLTIPVQVNQP